MTRRTEPGLVAFYNIWPGNRAGLFLQPRSPHGAITAGITYIVYSNELSQTTNPKGSFVVVSRTQPQIGLGFKYNKLLITKDVFGGVFSSQSLQTT